MTYAFGNFVLDLQLFQLRNGGQVIPLEPKVFDVLRYLVEHHDRVATKKELLEALWPNEVVTEAVLPTNINALRRALGQTRGEKVPIETVHGRGYRFALPVVRTLSVPAPFSKTPSAALLTPEAEEDEPLIGQSILLDKLKKVLVRALAEQGQICILRGETGIGKSRIAKHLLALARAQGADVWSGGCPEGLGTPPLWVWQEVLRSAKNSESSAGLRRFLGSSAVELSPWLYELLEDGEENPLARGERDRFRLYDVLVRLLTSASKVKPRVVYLEDLHRADDASWQLLRLLAPHLETLPVLLLCTVRSRDDLTTAMPVQRHVEDLARLPFCSRFQVQPLSEAETGQFLAARLKRVVSPDQTRLMYQKNDGNPLFLRELSEGMEVSAQGDLEALREGPALSPPELVRRVLLRRVERLGVRAAEVLTAAAVIGTSFDLSCLHHVTGVARSELLEIADAASQSRVIVPLPDRFEGYRFGHELIRDTLYSELKGQDRKRFHCATGEFLSKERLRGLSEKEVALHFYRGLPEGDGRVAIDWLMRAATTSETDGAYEDAASFYRYALDAARLLDDSESRSWCERLEGALRDVSEKKRALRVSAPS